MDQLRVPDTTAAIYDPRATVIQSSTSPTGRWIEVVVAPYWAAVYVDGQLESHDSSDSLGVEFAQAHAADIVRDEAR